MAKSEANESAVAILGMHRSGTSLITRVVNLLGAYLGEDGDMMQARPDNPEGFWEHRLVYGFHERLLEALGRSWDTALPLPPDWQALPGIAPFRNELLELIETHFRGQPIWAWKDPRACVLLPLWKDVLAELNIELACLLVTRNPLDVARSLEARNGFPLDDGLGLWFNHNLAMLHNSAGLPRIVVSYQRFLAEPEASVADWGSRLSLQWSERSEDLPAVLQKVVRRDLCHSASTLNDLSKAGCPKPVVELARVLESMAKTGDADNSAQAKKITRLLDDHTSLSRLYSHDFVRMQSANHDLQQEIEKQQAIIKDARVAANKQQQELSEFQSQMTQTQRQLALGDGQRETIERRLGDREQELARAHAQHHTLGQQLGNREQELAKARAQCETLGQQLGDREQELAKAAARCETAERQLAERDSEATAAQARCETLERQLAERDRELAAETEKRGTLQRQLQEREREVLDTRARLDSVERSFEKAQARLDQVTTSYSWRVTTPFRAVVNLVKSVF